MLNNNTAALNAVKTLSAQDIRAKLTDEITASLLALGTADQLVAARKNVDFDSPISLLPQVNAAGLVAGLKAAAAVTGAQELYLILPEADAAAADAVKAAAAELGLELTVEINDHVDHRDRPEALLVDFGTLAAVADVLAGGEVKAVVAVNGGEAVEIAYGSELSAILPEEAKAYLVGHRFYPASLREQKASVELLGCGAVIESVATTECIVQKCRQEILKMRTASCGRCTFCREGLYLFYRIFEDIARDKGSASDLAMLTEFGEAMKILGNCSLGDASALPVLTALDHFGDEIRDHVEKHNCATEQCSAFLHYYILPSACRGCGDCEDACEYEAIETKRGFSTYIDDYECTKCGKCIDVCPNGAIRKCSGRPPRIAEKPQRLRR